MLIKHKRIEISQFRCQVKLPGVRWHHDGKDHKAVDDHHTVQYLHSVLLSPHEEAGNNQREHRSITISVVKMHMTNKAKYWAKTYKVHACT